MANFSDRLGFSEDAPDVPSNVPADTEEIDLPYKEAAYDARQVEELAKNSLDFLAGLALPTVFKYLFPPVFQLIWKWLVTYVHRVRDFSQLAIGLPRGFGKTMLIKVFILYCILFTRKQFILVICGTQTKANNIIADVVGMLDELNVKRVFGDWSIGAESNRQDLKKFGFRGRNIILMGAGAESDIRGITLHNARPDIMIFDDIQTREDADSDVVSAKLETWLIGTAMKAKSPEGCLFIFIGNMYPTKHSLLRKIKANPTWVKFICGGILADGTSLWEELHPIEQLLREFENDLSMGKPEIFYAEVLNDENASVNNYIDVSKIPVNPYEADKIHGGNYIIIDPSTDKANADYVSIGYFEVFDGIPVIKEIEEGRFSPDEMCERAIKMALRHQSRLIAIESNAFQYILQWVMKKALVQYGVVGVEVVDIYAGSYSKITRILSMFKELLAGEVLIAHACRAQVFHQVVSFNPLKNNNVDGILDLLGYARKVMESYGEFIVSRLTIDMQEYHGIPVLTELDNAAF